MRRSMKEIVAEYNGLVNNYRLENFSKVKKFSTIATGETRLAKLRKFIEENFSSVHSVQTETIEVVQEVLEVIDDLPQESDPNVPNKKDLLTSRYPDAPIQDITIPVTRSEAREAGYKKYWNGLPCRHGHISVRYTISGQCKKCYQLFRADKLTNAETDKERLIKPKVKEPNE